jgi:hypothetical protein
MAHAHILPDLPLERIGLALSWTLAIFGAWGWLFAAGVWTGDVTARSAGFVLLAVLAIVVQIASNYAAAAARRARTWELWGSHRWAVALMVCGGLFNAYSLHHAWEVTGAVPPMTQLTLAAAIAAAPVLLISLGVSMFEPAIYWINEALAAEGAARRQPAPSSAEVFAFPRPAPARRTGLGRSFAAGALATLAAAGPGVAVAQAPAPMAAHAESAPKPRQGNSQAQKVALLMHDQPNMSIREMAARLGMPVSTVGKLAKSVREDQARA